MLVVRRFVGIKMIANLPLSAEGAASLLAWGNAPGTGAPRKARPESAIHEALVLIPDITLVEINAMLAQQRAVSS